jgi:hypothetical protein
MRRVRMILSFAGKLTVAAILAISAPAKAADVNMYDGNWHFDFTIYAWWAGINGTFKLPLPADSIAFQPDPFQTISVSPNDYLSSLQFGATMAGEARKGDWAVFTDLIYMDLANLKSKVRDVTLPENVITVPVSGDLNLGVRATVWTLGGSYTVARDKVGTLDVLGGFRYGRLKTSLDWDFATTNGILTPSGGASESVNLYDGIVGVRGAVALSDDGKWYVPYYADIGAGNSNWTWQAFGGVGYRFDWGAVVLGFRNLSYDMSAGKPVQNMNMTGPMLAFNLRW